MERSKYPNIKSRWENEYKCIVNLGSGSFGEVYLAQSMRTNDYVAVKVEDKTKPQKIKEEYEIYKYLNKNGFKQGIPKIVNFIETPSFTLMMMQPLGSNLEDIFTDCKQYGLSTVLLLAIDLLKLLEKLHDLGYIHRDIKPNNFLIGRNEEINKIYMMDFGLSKKYIVKNKHIDFRNGRSLIGTARYASINMHMGIEPCRRDDLESVGYMLIYFLKGKLPWQGIHKKVGVPHIKAIGEVKIGTSLDELCKDLPICFKTYLEYCRKLKFDQTPDYEYMKKLFLDTSKKMNLKLEYEWCNRDLNVKLESEWYKRLKLDEPLILDKSKSKLQNQSKRSNKIEVNQIPEYNYIENSISDNGRLNVRMNDEWENKFGYNYIPEYEYVANSLLRRN